MTAVYSTTDYKKVTDQLKALNLVNLLETIQIVNKANPHRSSRKSHMWKEQCYINFPILYLASLYLYNYAVTNNCDTILFATRDCCHWYKVFQKLYPNLTIHYFDCSRNMFELGIGNPFFKNYVSSLVVNLDKTIFVDIHGTGKRMFTYFETVFSSVPRGFILSATYTNYDQFPPISQKYYHQNKFINVIFNCRGSPIEMLNYDLMGTLQNYSISGPIRDPPEYNKRLIITYHQCMDHLLSQIVSPPDSTMENIGESLKKIFKYILVNKPIISDYITHSANHPKSSIVGGARLTDIHFEKIISSNTVYSLVWSGLYTGIPCAVKMMAMNTGINPKSAVFFPRDNIPFLHSEFINKKSVSRRLFNRELFHLLYLSKHQLAPRVYGSVIENKKYAFHYGFIIMEKLDGTVKDILQQRRLSEDEDLLIKNFITKIHQNIIHGDLKPSNLGVKLSPDLKIAQCFLLDCQKIKYRKNFDSAQFDSLKRKDWHQYDKHYKKNLTL